MTGRVEVSRKVDISVRFVHPTCDQELVVQFATEDEYKLWLPVLVEISDLLKKLSSKTP